MISFLLQQTQSFFWHFKKTQSNLQFFLTLYLYIQAIIIKEIQNRIQKIADKTIYKILY